SIAIIIITIIKSARSGFAKSLMETVGVLISFLSAVFLANILSQQVYDTYLCKYAYNSAEKIFENSVNTDGIQNALEAIPRLLQNALLSMNIDINNIDIAGAKDSAISSLVDTVFEPAIVFVIAVILFFIVYGVLKIFVRFAGRCLKSINDIPIIGGINKFFGALLGVIKGAVNLFLVAQVIHLIHIVFGESIPYISSAILSNTAIFSQIYNVNIFSIL
ncbi:MAG: CvpA family protein, partial [Oscillospiraceae bacterium]